MCSGSPMVLLSQWASDWVFEREMLSATGCESGSEWVTLCASASESWMQSDSTSEWETASVMV